ncbi:Crp/Fnr family transcriptional regulator [Pseudomonas leptonychotis]|uniref:Crp/Fnr family transcriptional regulator n=1 Tax=Pseudomonas leptonychotis TaxID=2448482 RepID=UPI0039EDFA1B
MALHRVHQQILRSHHLFEPLNEEQMEELMSSSHLLNIDKGSPIFRQGDPATSFYFVISGSVKVFRLAADGQEKVFDVLSARQTVAEAMLLTDSANYSACADALEPTQLYRLTSSVYLRLLQNNNRLAFALLSRLSGRMQQRLNEIETLSLKNSTHRVVRYLLNQLGQCSESVSSFSLPMAKQLIAGHLSIQPETFSRVIRRLTDEQVISQNGRQITILNRFRLEQFE